ncbi:MAG: DASS family sodium-coupled anion symporter [Phycisphaerales bacterium]|nr:DASS family sodium-coupled anion symporter [Phycisphaerales bacterium]
MSEATSPSTDSAPGPGFIRRAFLFGAPVVALVVYFILPEAPPGSTDPAALSHAARATAAVAVLMALWWLSEALPLEAVSLIPLAVFPILGIASISETARPYAQDIIFLFLGGMLLGQAVERWGLHRRAALVVVNAVGASPARLVAGLLTATAFISMWVSNTAAAVMMLPIATSVASLVAVELSRTRVGVLTPADHRGLHNLAISLILAVAFGASIGGVGTLIGTPPTAQMAAFIRQSYDHTVTFVDWLRLGIPILMVFVLACWVVLAKVCYPANLGPMPGVRTLIRGELRELGPMNRGERATLIVFLGASFLWIAAPLMGRWVSGLEAADPWRARLLFTTRFSDAGIAMLAALALFMLPAGNNGQRRPVLTWHEASRCPWGILILFGGGLSLAEAVKTTGLDRAIANQFAGLEHIPVLAVMFAFAALCVFLTELTSNTALVAAMLPLAAAMAEKMNAPPEALIVTATLAASLGFMLPMGTAPNALAFSTGRVTLRQMAKAGLVLDLLSVVLVPLVVYAAMRFGLLASLLPAR